MSKRPDQQALARLPSTELYHGKYFSRSKKLALRVNSQQRGDDQDQSVNTGVTSNINSDNITSGSTRNYAPDRGQPGGSMVPMRSDRMLQKKYSTKNLNQNLANINKNKQLRQPDNRQKPPPPPPPPPPPQPPAQKEEKQQQQQQQLPPPPPPQYSSYQVPTGHPNMVPFTNGDATHHYYQQEHQQYFQPPPHYPYPPHPSMLQPYSYLPVPPHFPYGYVPPSQGQVPYSAGGIDQQSLLFQRFQEFQEQERLRLNGSSSPNHMQEKSRRQEDEAARLQQLISKHKDKNEKMKKSKNDKNNLSKALDDEYEELIEAIKSQKQLILSNNLDEEKMTEAIEYLEMLEHYKLSKDKIIVPVMSPRPSPTTTTSSFSSSSLSSSSSVLSAAKDFTEMNDEDLTKEIEFNKNLLQDFGTKTEQEILIIYQMISILKTEQSRRKEIIDREKERLEMKKREEESRIKMEMEIREAEEMRQHALAVERENMLKLYKEKEELVLKLQQKLDAEEKLRVKSEEYQRAREAQLQQEKDLAEKARLLERKQRLLEEKRRAGEESKRIQKAKLLQDQKKREIELLKEKDLLEMQLQQKIESEKVMLTREAIRKQKSIEQLEDSLLLKQKSLRKINSLSSTPEDEVERDVVIVNAYTCAHNTEAETEALYKQQRKGLRHVKGNTTRTYQKTSKNEDIFEQSANRDTKEKDLFSYSNMGDYNSERKLTTESVDNFKSPKTLKSTGSFDLSVSDPQGRQSATFNYSNLGDEEDVKTLKKVSSFQSYENPMKIPS